MSQAVLIADGSDAEGGVDDNSGTSLCVTVRQAVACRAKNIVVACTRADNKADLHLLLVYFGAGTIVQSLGLFFDDGLGGELEAIRKKWLLLAEQPDLLPGAACQEEKPSVDHR